MAEDVQGESLAIVCPECREVIQIVNPRAVLLAAHLGAYCPETEGVLHGEEQP